MRTTGLFTTFKIGSYYIKLKAGYDNVKGRDRSTRGVFI
jgi:hypothetical protein